MYKIIDEKCLVIDEKNKAYEEVTDIAEKRKKQIDQLRLSIKTREDALSDLNNKNRSLLTQVNNLCSFMTIDIFVFEYTNYI